MLYTCLLASVGAVALELRGRGGTSTYGWRDRRDPVTTPIREEPAAQPNVSLVAATAGVTIVRQRHGTTTFVVPISHP
jgi:hypothetical protein